MMKSIGIFYILVCAMWIQAINPATASKYVSWKKGDHAVYADSSNNLIRIEIDNTSGKLVHYTNFAGLGPLWVQTSPDSEQVFIRITKKRQRQLLVDFDKPEGTVTNIQINPCNRGSVQIVSKNEKISVPAGEFKDVIQLALETSCADSGVTNVWFAPGVGFIKWESSNIAGSVTTELILGKIGKNTYPEGLLVSAFFPDPSVTIDMEPPVDTNRQPDTLSVYLVLTNNTDRDLTYQFSSGQLFEIKIIDADGDVVSLWSRGKSFTVAIQTLTLKQGEIWNFGGKIELTTDEGKVLPAGSYTLVIEMTSSPDSETDHQSGSERLSATTPLNIVHAL